MHTPATQEDSRTLSLNPLLGDISNGVEDLAAVIETAQKISDVLTVALNDVKDLIGELKARFE